MQPLDLHIYTRLIFGPGNASRFADADTGLGRKLFVITGGVSPLADRYCEGIMAEVLETLPKVIEDPENLHLRGVLLWASDLGIPETSLASNRRIYGQRIR